MTVTVLPTFKGYTVDLHRQEFRRALPDGTLETIRFLDHKGWQLVTFAQEVVECFDYK